MYSVVWVLISASTRWFKFIVVGCYSQTALDYFRNLRERHAMWQSALRRYKLEIGPLGRQLTGEVMTSTLLSDSQDTIHKHTHARLELGTHKIIKPAPAFVQKYRLSSLALWKRDSPSAPHYKENFWCCTLACSAAQNPLTRKSSEVSDSNSAPRRSIGLGRVQCIINYPTFPRRNVDETSD